MSENLSHNYANTLPHLEAEAGFRIKELSPDRREVLDAGDVLVSDEEAELLARQYAHDGTVKYLSLDQEPDTLGTYIPVEIAASKLDKHPEVKKIIGQSNSNYISSQVAHEAGLDALVEEEVRTAIEDTAIRRVKLALDRPYAELPESLGRGIEKVSQIFEVSNGKTNFQIMNYTGTILEGPKLKKMMNALREMDDLTGGTSSELLQLIAILPKELDHWSKIDEESAKIGAKKVQAVACGNRTIAINEELLEETPQVYEGKITDAISVGGSDIEVTLFHELTHIVESMAKRGGGNTPSEKFGWDIPRGDFGFIDYSKTPTFKGEVKNPSVYGQTDAGEDVAESAAAMFAGNEWDRALDDDRKSAIKEMYAQQHSGNHGPSFLRCEEVNLQNISSDNKYGSKLTQDIKIKPDLSYSINPEK